MVLLVVLVVVRVGAAAVVVGVVSRVGVAGGSVSGVALPRPACEADQ